MRPRANIHNIRDFEKFLLRNGFSRSEAKTIAGHGFKRLDNSPEGDVVSLPKLNAVDRSLSAASATGR